MTLPDFEIWAISIAGRKTQDIEEALLQAFNQGYHYGLNKGWANEMDKDIVAKENADAQSLGD